MNLYEVVLQENWMNRDFNYCSNEDIVGAFGTEEEAKIAKEILKDFVKTHSDNPIYDESDNGHIDEYTYYYVYIRMTGMDTLEEFKRFLEEDYIENFEYEDEED